MVQLTQDQTNLNQLTALVKREVRQYCANSHNAIIYPVLDDENQTYAVILIPHDSSERPAWVIIMARVVDNFVIIEEDTVLDKPLVDALIHNAEIPRDNIILAYQGESLPD